MKKLKKFKSRNKPVSIVGIVVLCAVVLLPFILKNTHAQTDTYTANVVWAANSCAGTINGLQNNSYFGAATGDVISLTIKNASPVKSISGTITEDNGLKATLPTILPGKTYTNNYGVTKWVQLSISTSAVTGCTTLRSPSLVIEGASGKLACSLVNNNTWHVSGPFANVVPSVALYYSAQNKINFNTTFSTGTQSALTLAADFNAVPTSTTFSLYNGPTSTSRLISQITCPAPPAPPAPPPPTPPPSKPVTITPTPAPTTPTSATTTPTQTSPDTTGTTTTPISTNDNSTPSVDSQQSTDDLSAQPTSKHSPSKVWLFLGVIVILLIIGGWQLLRRQQNRY